MSEDTRAYLKSLLENSPDGVFTIDPDLTIRYVNPAFCRLLGFTERELLGSSITNHLGDLNILSTCMAEVGATGHCNDQETIFKRADGRMVHISKNVQAIYDDQHRIREILVTIRDLTELHALNRRLEQMLDEREQANRKLSEALDALRIAQGQLVQAEKLAALGAMVAGIAHELNTPIGNALMAVSTLRDRLSGFRRSVEEGLRRSALEDFLGRLDEGSTIALRNLERAADLVTSFKQVAVDRTSVQRRRFRLGAVIDEILVTLSPTLKKGGVQVATAVPADLELDGYPGPLGQVLANLIDNAVVHGFEGRAGGTVRIEAAPPSDGQVELVVSDDGKGIPASRIGRIFDPFYTTRLGHGGSGLGLHVAYNLVSNVLGGTISVRSEEGGGASFRLTLPVTAPELPGA